LPDLDCHALSYLIDVLGIDGVNSHDALDDTQACANLFFRLLIGCAEGNENGGRHDAARP
jgi:DNA polymerase III epsilon subunit-like protein